MTAQINNIINRITIQSGLYWRLLNASGTTKASLGVAIFNLNSVDESFTNQENKQSWRYTFQGCYTLYDDNKIRFVPEALLVSQDNQHFVSAGFKTGLAIEGSNPFIP